LQGFSTVFLAGFLAEFLARFLVTTFTLAHLSDPHLPPLPAARLRDLANKRALGYLNWTRNRHKYHRREVLDALVADMQAQRPDHIAVTGDLVNLALEAEFSPAQAWLENVGAPRHVTVIPGNHDAYVRGAVASYSESWAAHMLADEAIDTSVKFPFVRRRGPVAIIGVSTAVATGPFMATGRIGAAQSKALAKILAGLSTEGLFRVVLIHHPPLAGSSRWHRRLVDLELAQSPIMEAGAELVIHGHDHKTSVAEMAGQKGMVPVVGAPAPSSEHGAYLLFDIDGSPGHYSCTMTERGAQKPDGSIDVISERRLI
jgi:3',5'-cyclic AMP phosphodiesterase CpdA